jgi:hypothetical protein
MSKLIGSASSLEQINTLINKYFYSTIELKPVNESTWAINNSKGEIQGFKVEFKKNRYRFVMENN